MARTPKARALGAALRAEREEKGLLLRELASAIHRDLGVLSRWETGERTPKPEMVAQILTKLGVDGERFDDIMTLAYGTDESQWVATTLPEQRVQMAAYVDWEQNATRIVEVAPLLVPGILQISDYIRAIMTAGGVPAGEIEERITYRIGRREVIKKDRPAQLLVLLGQGALYQDIGGPEVTVAQARHLLDLARQPHIDLRIMPDHSGWHPGLESAFALIKSDRALGPRRSADESIVFLGSRRSVLMLHEPGDVEAYRRAVDRIMRITMSLDASLKFIADVANGGMERK
jgi:transcriptional regulator with XRE-family HTH domain